MVESWRQAFKPSRKGVQDGFGQALIYGVKVCSSW